MDINSMTEKVQKAIMNAQNIAVREQHQEVDPVFLFHDLRQDRPIRIRQFSRGRHVRRETCEIEAFERRAVARHVGDDPRCKIDDAELHQPENLRALEAVDVLRDELCGDSAVGILWNLRFPERLFPGLKRSEERRVGKECRL